MSTGSLQDAREVLVRTKFFTMRPQPLEQWLWRQKVPPSAERVFWLHWQEGMRNRDWCSCIPLRRVATLCSLDISSVTRAYQVLARLDLIRRQDPGRDPARPFEQAVAITEVRVPRALLDALQTHPSRHATSANHTVKPDTEIDRTPAIAPVVAMSTHPEEKNPMDPLEGKSGRERRRELLALLSRLSPRERRQYDEALRARMPSMRFDEGTQVDGPGRAVLLRVLSIAASAPTIRPENPPPARPALPDPIAPRRLSVFELARLRHDLQRLATPERAAALLREVAWAVEQGALQRFASLHAIRIALKKVREGLWTRPHRMPPNWSRELSLVGARMAS